MKLKQLHEASRRSILSTWGQQPVHMETADFAAGDLDSLEGGPSTVSEYYRANENNLTSLQFAPTYVGRYFNCCNNKLTNLHGVKMTTEELFNCGENKIASLEGMSITCRQFYCRYNELTSLKDIHKQLKFENIVGSGGLFHAEGNPQLTKNLVGLLLVKGITGIVIDNPYIENILNKYMAYPNKKLALLQCQQKLIEAGYEDAAQL